MLLQTFIFVMLAGQPGLDLRASRVAQARAPAPAEKTPEPGKKQAVKEAEGKTPAEEKPAVPASGMDSEVKALVERMQAFYEKTGDFTATFEQKYTYKIARRTQTSTGTVTFKKPALMRWEYKTPGEKTFVLAGEFVYMHDPEAMLLTKARVGTNQLSASVTFLWGQGRLEDEFTLSKVACKACAGVRLELVPKKADPRFKKIYLEVDPKTAQVLKSTVIDPDGSENAISFKGLKTNTGVTKERFKLNPPQGTQVQDFTK